MLNTFDVCKRMTIFSLLVLVSNPKKKTVQLRIACSPIRKRTVKKGLCWAGLRGMINFSILMKDNGTESESRQSSIFHISRPLNGEQLSTATLKLVAEKIEFFWNYQDFSDLRLVAWYSCYWSWPSLKITTLHCLIVCLFGMIVDGN